MSIVDLAGSNLERTLQLCPTPPHPKVHFVCEEKGDSMVVCKVVTTKEISLDGTESYFYQRG